MKRYSPTFGYLASIYVASLAFSSIFRLILVWFNIQHLTDAEQNTTRLLEALVRGVQFDNLVACYIMTLPLLIWSILVLLQKQTERLVTPTNIYFMATHFVIFGTSAVDIRYFTYFFSHIDTGAFGWLKFAGTTAGMIFEDASNYLFILLFFLLWGAFCWVVLKAGQTWKRNYQEGLPDASLPVKIPVVTVLLGLCFLGMRGTLQRYPLSVSFAYFSTNSFLNQVPINPAFYLLKSYERSLKQQNNVNNLMDTKEAIKAARASLGITPVEGDSTLDRQVVPANTPTRPNVVIVLMESMSKANLSLQHNGKPLTRYLNSLIKRSYFFDNFYSAGVHTNNGIVATLYAAPTQFNKPMMQDMRIAHYGGLPQELQRIGYQTLFFVTGNPQYDSMNSFLKENNISEIISQYDFPKEKIVNNFGVQDDYLLEYGVNKLTQTNQPFLATFLTVSNHDPIVVPEPFKGIGGSPKEDVIAFADHAIEQFMEKAKSEKWFNNTIFVFLGDHGANTGQQKYEMPLSYNQIPLIIYSPIFQDAPKRFSCLGGQIDVYPTIMGLLNQPYTNKTLGVDLLKEKRKNMFFVNDTQLGCIDNDFLYIRNILTNRDFLFDLHAKEAHNLVGLKTRKANELKKYGIAMTVAGDYLGKINVALYQDGKVH